MKCLIMHSYARVPVSTLPVLDDVTDVDGVYKTTLSVDAA